MRDYKSLRAAVMQCQRQENSSWEPRFSLGADPALPPLPISPLLPFPLVLPLPLEVGPLKSS